MGDKSYPIIEVSAKTLQILKYVAKRAAPVTTKEIEAQLDIKYATVMAHLATLERENYIENVEGGFIGSLELATFWAARRSMNKKRQKTLDNEYRQIGKENDNG